MTGTEGTRAPGNIPRVYGLMNPEAGKHGTKIPSPTGPARSPMDGWSSPAREIAAETTEQATYSTTSEDWSRNPTPVQIKPNFHGASHGLALSPLRDSLPAPEPVDHSPLLINTLGDDLPTFQRFDGHAHPDHTHASKWEGEAKRLDPDTRKKYKQVFSKFDVDGSGLVSIDELKSMLKQLGIEKSDAEVEDIMKEADPDGSGEIDFDEFCHIMQNEAFGDFGAIVNAAVTSFFKNLNPLNWFVASAGQR